MSRTGGGIGTRGPGETEFERHRRKLELRIKSITKRLDDVRRRRGENRERRRRGGVPLAALVGYTNSGKSTLLAPLSKDAGILAKDQLFSTLDTVVRRIETGDGKLFLLSDTVGFIRKLPPERRAASARRSKSCERDLLLLVLDSADKDPCATLDVVLETLEGLARESCRARDTEQNRQKRRGGVRNGHRAARARRARRLCLRDRGAGFGESLSEIGEILRGPVAQTGAEDIYNKVDKTALKGGSVCT